MSIDLSNVHKAFCVALSTAFLAAGCATTLPVTGSGARPDVEAGGDEGEVYNEFERVGQGHDYMRRLVCPDGTAANLLSVAFSRDDARRFIDVYWVECPGLPNTPITVLPVGPLPEPPTGFVLIDPDLYAELDGMWSLTKRDPEKVIRRTTELLDSLPGVHLVLGLRAMSSLRLNDYRSALADLDQIVDTDPDPDYGTIRVHVIRMLGDLERARAEAVIVRNSLDTKAKNYADRLCLIGIQRVQAGDEAGSTDVMDACKLEIEDCCQFIRENVPGLLDDKN
ncbi:MAG TPA: hypothetical protein PLY68_06515 [Myxococcota bacterium]|nr:hypothetical protein [Myxococcota bacterium]HNZ03271.1 hypothetical protein [Myxococcota bacterium]HOD07367.1 hypothetical protein [Myxococcota bacterium]HPB50843.1 hypothetical protein [Myxococcota bacterium]HQP95835.1 hypothetical protein [Myxococcota bacterium]